MRITAITAVLLVWLSGTALAQTAEDLKQDASTPHNVLTLGMGYGLQRYSTLVQVNKKSVKRLVPIWNYSRADTQGQESQPLVLNGVMYVTTHNSTAAVGARIASLCPYSAPQTKR